MWKPWRKLAFACASAIAAVGCGDGRPERVPIAGRVLVDGQPLEHGNIRIHPQNQRASLGKLGPGGVFTMSTYEIGDGCVPGDHTVSVYAVQTVNPRTQRWHAPKKYASPLTSGLTLNVIEPTDAAEIHLTWNGGKPFDERVEGGGD